MKDLISKQGGMGCGGGEGVKVQGQQPSSDEIQIFVFLLFLKRHSSKGLGGRGDIKGEVVKEKV